MMKLILDNTVLERYEKFYFNQHPRARKKPIAHPYHPSINQWFILQRQAMNTLKQQWKDFIIWWVKDLGLENKNLDNVELTFTTYMPTRRRIDTDNTVPKFILDGMVESGLIVDDDSLHLKRLILCAGYDKDNPRTEILIQTIDE